MIKRRRSRQIKVGRVKIGGSASISMQSMVKVETRDVSKVVSQIKALERCGCEIIRVAVKNLEDADAIKQIKRNIKIPLVADIHFDHRLALAAIENGADKIRLNPGNIKKRGDIETVIKAARSAKIPIRIGVNSGSVAKSQSHKVTGSQSDLLVKVALGYIKIFEDMNFRDIIISLKGSDVTGTVNAYKRIAELCDYPLHLGITASGPYNYGIVKSAIGIGALLLDGIGDTIRVSLTADPVEEVVAAKRILGSLGLRKFGPDIISCPTCGRCQVDLVKIVEQLEKMLSAIRYPLSAKSPVTIAMMGCEVNGPGEAKEADIGIAFGKNSGLLFKKGKIVKRVTVRDAIKELLKNI